VRDRAARQLWQQTYAGTLGNWAGLSESTRDRMRRIVADLDDDLGAGELLGLVRAYLGAVDELLDNPTGADILARMIARDDLLHALYIAAGMPCDWSAAEVVIDTHGRL
jgi:hypothetical protein